MIRTSLLLIALAAVAQSAEVKTMTLREAIAAALQQNPELLLARLDQQKARYNVTIERDPFQPKVYVTLSLLYCTSLKSVATRRSKSRDDASRAGPATWATSR